MKKYFFLIILFLFFFMTPQARAAITAGAGTASSWVSSSPQDVSVNIVSGSNIALFVAIGGNADVTSVTYNGANLTKLWNQADGAGWSRSSAWILANPSVGTNTLHIVWASSPSTATVWAQPWYGVAQGNTQGTTWRVPVFGSGNSATASQTVSNAVSGDIVLDVAADYGSTPTKDSSQTLQHQDNAPAGTQLYWGTSSKPAIGATTMQWTMTSTYWSLGAVALIPADITPLDTQAPTTPTNLSATALFSSQINLSWTASTDNVGVTGYNIYRGGTQIGTSATNSYSDSGLSPSTSYSYTVSAYDGAGNNSSQSSSASATTQAPAPTPPVINSFSASPSTIQSGNSSTLSWSVSNATSLSISGIGTVTGTSRNISPTNTTTYTLTATNATGNATANTTVTVTQPDTTSPSTPTNLSATAVSSSQINLSWTASTDNVGVTGYKIYRTGTQIGTSATNSYSDTGLSPSTSYSYTVSSYDAAGNNSSQSSTTSTTTQAQQTGTYLWSGILDSSRAIDWSQSGIPGGIPNRTTICATINASTYGNGTNDSTAGIQNALNNCPQNQVVLLSAGTFRINSSLSIPSYVTLRGSGAHNTILDLHGSAYGAINMGASDLGSGGAVNITGGTGAGSISITVSNTSGITVGSYLHINELNDPAFVNITGAGTCTWCDEWWNGTRVRGQISEVTSVNGNTIGISPSLFYGYTHAPQAISFTALVKYAGLEDLQLYANNTGYTTNIQMNQSAYSWVKGVESNFADGDHVHIWYSYRNEIRDSYFHDAFRHTSGGTDADLNVAERSTGILLENNILTRLHLGTMLEWGAAGNVIAYNYLDGNYDTSATNVLMYDTATHGAHTQYNLWEGNVTAQIRPDSYWGSNSWGTFFRNWATGITQICLPYSTRGAVGACHNSTQGNNAFNLDFLNYQFNIVGNIFGSAALKAWASPEVATVMAGETRSNYGGVGYDIAVGYNDVSDSQGSGTCTGTRANCMPFATGLFHGNYTNANNTISWAYNIPSGHNPANPSQTLPASFYLSSKPSWWGSLPWPAIGPDVTGGTGPGGHTSLTASNPAQACYKNIPKDSNGYLIFDPNSCYGGGGSSTTFTLTSSSGTGGTITPSGVTTVNSGSSQTYTITPNSGYMVSSILVDGVSQATSTTYTFNNVTNNHIISVSFSLIQQPDTTAPTTPTNLTATIASSTQINLSWSASTDPIVSGQTTSGVVGYKIYRNGSLLATANSLLTTYSDTNLFSSTSYTYTVAAYDAANNTSGLSASISATTPSGTPILGDINLDHIINTLDYSLMNSKWFQSYPSYDLTGDNLINTLDYAILKNNWGRTW